MWRVALVCLAAAGCNQVFGLDPASGTTDGSNPGSDSTPQTCEQTGCGGTTPVCDSSSHACVACSSHADCNGAGQSDVCIPTDFPDQTLAGSCADEAAVVYLSQNGSGDCSKDTPCGSFATALGQITTTKRFMKVSGTINTTSPTPVNGQTFSIFSEPGSAFSSTGTDALHVTSGKVGIYDLGLTSLTDHALSIDAAGEVRLEHVTVHDTNNAVGILSSGTLTMTRSTVKNNMHGGIDIESGSFDITNTFITSNTVGTSGTGGIRASNSNPSRFEFNTIADNHSSDGGSGAGGMTCSASFAMPNNLFSGNTDTNNASKNDISNCDTTSSLVIPDITQVHFVSTTDFHLTPQSTMVINHGNDTGMIRIDVDNQSRPDPVDNIPDIGADELMNP